ncbi:hypothetical protein CC86DRAFT_103560 [Ophiobolus disseminans]|uniref:Secreted protein n=1 Tax=Ophiobolus disseminans TaxID=1469910 RepID=A0A6A6ZJY0_9PLEO|nr:hypothetical protein CC86DRAFT_103560 [Ophiobolus disseminans]
MATQTALPSLLIPFFNILWFALCSSDFHNPSYRCTIPIHFPSIFQAWFWASRVWKSTSIEMLRSVACMRRTDASARSSVSHGVL